MEGRPQLIVVGCPRSGTSLFAKLLSAAGLRTVEDARQGEKYPSGYYEYPPLIMFHKAMERYPRSTPNRSDHAITEEEFLKAEYLNEPFVRLMFERAFEPFLDRRVDFIKYPQLCLSPKFLLETFPNAHIVALWRDPEVTIHSLARAEFSWDLAPFRGARAVMLWGMYAHHICRAKELGPDRVSVLSSDALVRSSGVGPLLARLGYEAADVNMAEVAQPGLWTRSVNLPRKVYGQALWRTLRRTKNGASFADIAAWETRLASISESLPMPEEDSVDS